MVIDTSAIIAILLQEDEAESFAVGIREDPIRLVSAVSALEAAMVIEAKAGLPGGRELDLLLHRGRMAVVPFDSQQAETARTAWRRFGKGRHAAGLNLGDCCAYALAKTSGERLLFKGGDFSQTDVSAVQLSSRP